MSNNVKSHQKRSCLKYIMQSSRAAQAASWYDIFKERARTEWQNCTHSARSKSSILIHDWNMREHRMTTKDCTTHEQMLDTDILQSLDRNEWQRSTPGALELNSIGRRSVISQCCAKYETLIPAFFESQSDYQANILQISVSWYRWYARKYSAQQPCFCW